MRRACAVAAAGERAAHDHVAPRVHGGLADCRGRAVERRVAVSRGDGQRSARLNIGDASVVARADPQVVLQHVQALRRGYVAGRSQRHAARRAHGSVQQDVGARLHRDRAVAGDRRAGRDAAARRGQCDVADRLHRAADAKIPAGLQRCRRAGHHVARGSEILRGCQRHRRRGRHVMQRRRSARLRLHRVAAQRASQTHVAARLQRRRLTERDRRRAAQRTTRTQRAVALADHRAVRGQVSACAYRQVALRSRLLRAEVDCVRGVDQQIAARLDHAGARQRARRVRQRHVTRR